MDLSADALGPLSPDGSQALTLTVSIPPGVAWFQTQTVIITAISVTTPTRYMTFAQILTDVAPPLTPYLPAILM